jgi:hypothetical protein
MAMVLITMNPPRNYPSLDSNKRTQPQVSAFPEKQGEPLAENSQLSDKNVQPGHKMHSFCASLQRWLDQEVIQ